jgi:Cu-Zn family superoxide dismutase
VLCSCSSKEKKDESMVSTSLAHASISGKAQGEVSFVPTVNGVVMKVAVSGLKPNGTHGYHIHEFGRCDKPDYKSAGGHFNPGKHSHGGPSASLKHMGDLGNLVANDKGVAEKEILMRDLKDVNAIKNKAIIIHEKADDYLTQPTGNSGGRIACGVIRLKE